MDDKKEKSKSKKFRPAAELDGTKMKTPSKRANFEMEPPTPSPVKGEGILKIKESELLTQIRTIVTEVIRKEFHTRLNELEDRLTDVDTEIKELKTIHRDSKSELEAQLITLTQDMISTRKENKILQEEFLRMDI